jgi:hypothetical protein
MDQDVKRKGNAQSAAFRETMLKCWADPQWRADLLARREGRRADGLMTTTGLPKGLDLEQFKFFRRQARFEATMTMKKLDKAGVLDDCDEYAREALHAAIETMRMPIPPKDKISAARLVLDFTKAKPAQKQEITVTKAEEWLAAVTEDNGKTDEGADRSA